MNRTDVIDALLTIYFVIRLVVVAILAVFMLLKALVFRRAGKFGSSIAKSNVAIVVAFVGSIFLLAGFDFFATWPWSLGVLVVITIYVVKAAQSMADLYGGWTNLMREAKLTLRDLRMEWRRQPLGMKIAITILLLDLFAAVALTEVKGVPREIALPQRSIHLQATPEP